MASIVDPDPDDNPDAHNDWADCPLIAQTVRFETRGKRYYTVRVKTNFHQVEVYVSPQGRSVRVYVDGVEMTEEAPDLDALLAGGRA